MSRSKIPSMITNSNQACFTKMVGCGFQEATFHRGPLACLKNRQKDSPQISRGYPKDKRFLLKRLKIIRLPFHVEGFSPGRCPL